MKRTIGSSGLIGRLVVVVVLSAALGVVILAATAFAQGNAAQEQYGGESTPTSTPTPPSESSSSTPPSDSSSTPNLKEWHPPSGSSDQGDQPLSGSDQAGQPQTPGDQGGSKVPGGGEKISEKNHDGDASQQPPTQQQHGPQTNLQKQGQPDRQKDGLIKRIIGFLNPILNGGNPSNQGQGKQQIDDLIIRIGRLLISTNEAMQGRPQNLLHPIYCTLFPNAFGCQGTTNQANTNSGGNSQRNTGGGAANKTKLRPDFTPSKDSGPSAKMKPRQGLQTDKPDQKQNPNKEQEPPTTKKEQKPPTTKATVIDGWSHPMPGGEVIGFGPGEGDHNKGGRDEFAVDFFSGAKDPAVYPTRPGKVVYAGYDCKRAEPIPDGTPPCYGNVVVIDHGDGLYSIYAHLKDGSFDPVPPSDAYEVTPSDKIGTMGDSGCGGKCGLRGEHLHFAVRKSAPNLGANALYGANTSVKTPWTKP